MNTKDETIVGEEKKHKEEENKKYARYITKDDLKNFSQKEITSMNDFILVNYPACVNLEWDFPNGISCASYCLAVIRRDMTTRNLNQAKK